ncbi:MAG: gliding motility-associated C-terminal domain-containing protein [Odoribacter sp.]|nr:gliding motility-associated C-terminal domain-containing protein [Odoribacter sp.]
MKRQYIPLIIAIILPASALAQSAKVWIGDATRSITETPPATTGLQYIIIAENTSGQNIYYRPDASENTVQWQRFSSLGGGYAEDIKPIKSDDGYWYIPAGNDDMGYIITDGTSRTCLWVVNYANHIYNVSGIYVESSDCSRVFLHVDTPANAIAYYTVNGRRMELDRDIQLVYYTLEYNEDDNNFSQKLTNTSFESLNHTISAPVPLCDTQFTLNPDRFATAWGLAEPQTTPIYTTSAVDARTKADQTPHEASNEQPVEAELGGSAPCEITFSAAVTDAAIYRRWEISSMPDFEDVIYTYDALEFSYTFNEAGTLYVRFTANNAEASCEYIGDVYTVSVGESYLECPNAFSPGTSEGVNDEWKVSYRSIISFDCIIVNRWGQQIAHLTHPSQGWDGRHGGKLVGPGVYFYVIKARGSDNKEYNLSGDINIIGVRRNNTPVIE